MKIFQQQKDLTTAQNLLGNTDFMPLLHC